MHSREKRRRGSRPSVLASSVCFCTICLAGAKPAAAEGALVGAPRSWIVTGEDMLGYFSAQTSYKDENNRDFSATRNYLSFPFRTGGTKLGLYYFIARSLSLGGSVGFESRSGTNTYEDGGGVYARSVGTETTFLLQPKVGYVLGLTPVTAFWFRAGPGFRYDRNRANDYQPDSSVSDSSWHLSGDVLFLITPVAHFGFYVGPTGDISFAGNHHEHIQRDNAPPTDWSHGASYSRLGLGLGLVGYF